MPYEKGTAEHAPGRDRAREVAAMGRERLLREISVARSPTENAAMTEGNKSGELRRSGQCEAEPAATAGSAGA
jgi:hypothetical protein